MARQQAIPLSPEFSQLEHAPVRIDDPAVPNAETRVALHLGASVAARRGSRGDLDDQIGRTFDGAASDDELVLLPDEYQIRYYDRRAVEDHVDRSTEQSAEPVRSNVTLQEELEIRGSRRHHQVPVENLVALSVIGQAHVVAIRELAPGDATTCGVAHVGEEVSSPW
jgi:hypothetical protein